MISEALIRKLELAYTFLFPSMKPVNVECPSSLSPSRSSDSPSLKACNAPQHSNKFITNIERNVVRYIQVVSRLYVRHAPRQTIDSAHHIVDYSRHDTHH